MTTYKSPNCTAATLVPARGGIGPDVAYATFEASVELATDDVIQMVTLPIGATVVDVVLSVDQLDSGTDFLISVGDGDDVDRYIASSTIAQGGGTVRIGDTITGAAAANCLGKEYTAEDTIDVYITLQGTGNTGTIKLAVRYTMQQ